MIRNKKLNKVACFIALLLSSFVFMAISCRSINPFTQEYVYSADSSAFLVIGKGWANGLLPYIDLWDSKGPLIFFINMLGFLTEKPLLTMFVIEVIVWLINEVFIFKTIRTEYDCPKALILTVIIQFFSTVYCCISGNCVEDYCMPFISASVYFLVLFLNNIKDKSSISHNPWYAVIYGIAFSVCLLTRITNAIIICSSFFVIALFLIINKKWKNLLLNGLAFIGGCAVLCLPFMIYYAVKGHLYDLIYGTLIYNISYMGNSTTGGYPLALSLVKIAVMLFTSVVLLVLGVVLVKNKKAYSDLIKGIVFILTSAITIVYFLKSNQYSHYLIIVIPYSALIFTEIKRMSLNHDTMKGNQKKYKVAMVIVIAFHIAVAGSGSVKNCYQLSFKEYDNLSIVEDIDRKDLEESFVAYNFDSGIYLKLNCFPCYKYFAYQDWAESMTEFTKNDLISMYSTCKAKWILLDGNEKDTLINEILEEKYECVKVQDNNKLFKLKEST